MKANKQQQQAAGTSDRASLASNDQVSRSPSPRNKRRATPFPATQVSDPTNIISERDKSPRALSALAYEYLQNPDRHNPYYLVMQSISQNLDKALRTDFPLYPTSFTPSADTYLAMLQNIKNNKITNESYRWKIVDSGASKNYDYDTSFIINPSPHSTKVTGLNGASDFSCHSGTSCSRLPASNGQLVPFTSMSTCLANTGVDLLSVPMITLQGHKVVHDGDPVNGHHGIKVRGPNGERTKLWIPFTFCPKSGVWWIQVYYGTPEQIEQAKRKTTAEALLGGNKRTSVTTD
mmetsp:Transcript_10214/g.20430  ORF Transcript_10214/g.20430 Transcript_10214/m.20430 type:complete len:291 (-) Transcript_10214:1614-2486(-)